MALSKFKAPQLPMPPKQYDQRALQQLNRLLQIYFAQLDSATPNYAQSYTADEFIGGTITGDTVEATAFYGGDLFGYGEHIVFPYNQFISNTDQAAANTYTAYEITFDSATFTDSISLATSSHIRVSYAGVYKFDFSISLKNTTNDSVDIDIWFRKNGSDIANSNSKFSIPARKSTSDPSYLIAVTPFMLSMVGGDYVELMWKTSDIGATIEHIPAVVANPGVTPAIPATPSVILDAKFISALPPSPFNAKPVAVFGLGQVGVISVSTP